MSKPCPDYGKTRCYALKSVQQCRSADELQFLLRQHVVYIEKAIKKTLRQAGAARIVSACHGIGRRDRDILTYAAECDRLRQTIRKELDICDCFFYSLGYIIIVTGKDDTGMPESLGRLLYQQPYTIHEKVLDGSRNEALELAEFVRSLMYSHHNLRMDNKDIGISINATNLQDRLIGIVANDRREPRSELMSEAIDCILFENDNDLKNNYE